MPKQIISLKKDAPYYKAIYAKWATIEFTSLYIYTPWCINTICISDKGEMCASQRHNHHSYKHIQEIQNTDHSNYYNHNYHTSKDLYDNIQDCHFSSLISASGRISLCTRWCHWPWKVTIKFGTREVRGLHIRALGHPKFNEKMESDQEMRIIQKMHVSFNYP